MMKSNKICGFDNEVKCSDMCRYYNTCTRNPHKYTKEGQKINGRKKDVHTENCRQ